MNPTGGRITVVQGSLPNIGPGAVENREGGGGDKVWICFKISFISTTYSSSPSFPRRLKRTWWSFWTLRRTSTSGSPWSAVGSRSPSTSSSSPGELIRRRNGLKKISNFIQLFCCFQPTLRPGYPFWHLQVLRRTSQSNILSPKIIIHYQDQSLSGTVENFFAPQVQTFPGYHSHHNPPQAERFERALRRYLTRKVQSRSEIPIVCIFSSFVEAFKVSVLRLDLKLWWEYVVQEGCPCTRSTVIIFSFFFKILTLKTFAGHFFVRSTDLLSLPNVNPDSAFGMQVRDQDPYVYIVVNDDLPPFYLEGQFNFLNVSFIGFYRGRPKRLAGGELSGCSSLHVEQGGEEDKVCMNLLSLLIIVFRILCFYFLGSDCFLFVLWFLLASGYTHSVCPPPPVCKKSYRWVQLSCWKCLLQKILNFLSIDVVLYFL